MVELWTCMLNFETLPVGLLAVQLFSCLEVLIVAKVLVHASILQKQERDKAKMVSGFNLCNWPLPC